jgi:phosphatidylserine/phosphatidylglycerophosphate/cardiolipin synthase-like enzyme
LNNKKLVSIVLGVCIIGTLLTGCGSQNVSAKSNIQTTQTKSTQAQDNNQIETYFTRKDGNLDQILIKEINTAQKSLNIAIYSLTKDNIADALIDAKKKGIDIKVITDKQESSTKGQKAILDKIKSNGIPVKINSHTGLMHLKLTIVDDKIVCGGSYNYTANATKNNDENLIIMKDTNIIKEYIDEYNSMWSNTNDYANY